MTDSSETKDHLSTWRSFLGIGQSRIGRPVSREDREKERTNEQKRAVLTQVIESHIPSEDALFGMLSWTQAKRFFPMLHELVTAGSKAFVAKLKSGIGNFFGRVGRSHKKAAAALLLSNLTLDEAHQVSGLSKNYLSQARSRRFDVDSSRLVKEEYTPQTERQRVNPLEVECHVQWHKDALGSKSGQVSGEDRYLYDSPSTFYVEKYQRGGFRDIMQKITTRLREQHSGEELDHLCRLKTRFWSNCRVFLKDGHNAKIYIPHMEPDDIESNSDSDGEIDVSS